MNAAGDDLQYRINLVEFFDDLQRRGRPRPVPYLSAWLARLLEPVVESLHSERRRKQLDKQLQSVASRGDLYALHTLLDSGCELAKDSAEYRRARAEYLKLEGESRRLATDHAGLAESAKRYGSGIAALIGYLVFLVTSGYVAFGVIA